MITGFYVAARRVLQIVLFSLIAAQAHAVSPYPYTPVAVTGFTLDVIAENGPAGAFVTGGVDLGDYVFYSTTYPAGPHGLPSSGTLVDGQQTYQLQPYTAPNAMRLMTAGVPTGTLTLTTPESYESVSVLLTSTDGDSNTDVTINFTDASSTTTSLVVGDWFVGASAFSGYGRTRISAPNSFSGGPTHPVLRTVIIDLNPADQLKQVASVTVTNNSAVSSVVVLGVSAASTPSAIPTLSEWTLLLLGAALLAAAAWGMRNRRRAV